MNLGFFTSLWVRGRSLRGFILALCWMLLFGLCAPVQAKRIALVIGNDQYASVEKLKNARNDARLIASVLTKAGFGVTQANDLGREGLWSTIDAFKSNIGKGDEVVFYFAGHGLQIGSTQLLLPTDINPKSEAQVQRDGVPLIEVQDAFKDARVAIFIIDACRDNPFPKQGTRTLGESRGMLPPEPSAGQIIMLSAGRNQKALDQVPGQNVSNGLFTWELAQAIQNPGMEIRSALERVKDLVDDKARAAQHEQRPSLVNDLRGNFYFFGPTTVQVAPPAPVAPAAPAAVTAEQEERFWEDAKAAGNQEAYDAYLENYPKGRYASLARANLARLNAAKAAAQKLATDAAAERANKAEQERRAAEEAQKAAQTTSTGRLAAEAATKEQDRLALLAQARVAAEAAQKLAAARLAELPKPGQVIKDCADCPEMVVLPAGSFEMGSNESANERPVRRVNVPGFLIGKTEVTQGHWKALMGSNPSYFSSCGDDCPVERVNWDDAQEFAKRLSQKTGKQYRLPSEAEWEYAARAGSSTKWSFGDAEYQLVDYAWYGGNSQNRTQRMAQKRPNAFGVHDMHGNVWEWTQDCWHDNYTGAPTDGSAWTTGHCRARALRGGSWVNIPSYLRLAYRDRYMPDNRLNYVGLRLARTLFTP